MQTQLSTPRYWPTWLVVGILKLVVRLPLRAQFSVGRTIGRVFERFGGRRARIAAKNIELCFPELDEKQRRDLVDRVFKSIGITVIETAYTWLRPLDPLRPRTQIHGLDELRQAAAEGKGVLLVGAHFAVLDIGGAILAAELDFDCLYRKSRSAVFEHLSLTRRRQLYGCVIDRADMRTTVRQLKNGRIVWYAADQDNGRKYSVFAPFFGIPAATINVTSRLARVNGSPVVFMSHFRDEENQTWSVHLRRIHDYPTGDEIEDATIMNRVIETEIRKHPEQYLWIHRRFKTKPDGGRREY